MSIMKGGGKSTEYGTYKFEVKAFSISNGDTSSQECNNFPTLSAHKTSSFGMCAFAPGVLL